ncbi:MAG: ankyrin repeat domain-containing protein [Candidatus Hydrogenedentales bacterium]|jgi:hypothetical protein
MSTRYLAAEFCLAAILVSLGVFHVLYTTDRLPMTVAEANALVRNGLKYGDWDDVRRGVRKGAEPDGFSGSSPHTCLLCMAVMQGDLETVRLVRDTIVEKEGEQFWAEHRGIVVTAIKRADTEMVSILLKGGGASKSVWNQKSPLHVAIESGSEAIVWAMLEHDTPSEVVDASWLAAIKDPAEAATMLRLLKHYNVKFYEYYPYC